MDYNSMFGGTSTSGSSASVATNPLTGKPYTGSEYVASTVGNAGTLFKLPEMGFSELVPTAYAAEIAPQKQQALNQAVLGTQTPNYSVVNKSVVPTNTTQPAGTPAPQPTNDNSDLIRQYQSRGWTDMNAILSDINAGGYKSWDNYNKDINQEIENAYNAKMGYLGDMENTLRGQLPGILGEIESQYGTSRKSLEGAKESGMGKLSAAEEASGQRRTDVLNAARRLFNELAMGGQQRFGSASSAGQAFSELSNREFQRNVGQGERAYTEALGQIQQQKSDLDMTFQNSLAQLENNALSAKAQARRDFDDKLSQINAMRAEAGVDKANLRLQALSDLRNQLFNMEMQKQQMQQSIQSQYTQNASQLDQALAQFAQQAQGGQVASQNMIAGTNVNPRTGLTIGGSVPSAWTQPVQQLFGRRDDELPTGSILPTDRDLFLR